MTLRLAREGDCVTVQIDDDGAGMSAHAMASFGQRRSQRLVDAGGQAPASLGLGSVIARAIVALHGGQITLASSVSDPGCAGTRVTLAFPAHAGGRG